MTTTLQSHDRATTSVPAGAIPAQRSAPPARVALPAPERTPRRWPVLAGGIGAALAVSVAGAVGLGQPTTPAAAPAANGFVANVSVPGRALTSIDDGVWQVGIDVAPGTYTSTGSAGPACRAGFRRTRTGADEVSRRGPATVVLTESDGWFATSGCATWTRVG